MLREIAQNGTPEQRERATQTFQIAAQLRGQRVALAGLSLFVQTATAAGKHRKVYSADNARRLPGRLLRDEGDPATGDLAADEAYDGAGVTYDLFNEVYHRRSMDNNDMELISTVHYDRGYDNAMWNGEQMVYGDGDEDLPESQRLFNRFTAALDVIAHEMTHGITQFEAKLVYQGQSGALNESFSDVFGSLVKQRGLNQTADQADWIIGSGLFSPNVNGVGIRSMKAPGTAYNDPVLGKDPQPGHMNDYQNVPYDNGGVHINSGIPNRAFYVTAREMGGYAWEKAGQVWYNTLCDYLTMASTFQDAANATYTAAGNLFGQGSMEQQAVKVGWAEVGITVGTEAVPTVPSGCAPMVNQLMRMFRMSPSE
jgi:Zn-dependent metalloprotease